MMPFIACTSGIAYVINAEDRLVDIAQQNLGDSSRWTEITKPDGTHFTQEEAKRLQPGRKICLPKEFVPPQTGRRFATIVSRETYEAMFPNRNNLYSYDNLIAAVGKFPRFCNEGTDEQCRREVAAFLANIAHETSGLYYIEEVNKENWPKYCDASNTAYPCVPGRTYHGRGPIQLSWNYNYGAATKALGVDLLANPDLVASDGAIAFRTALWFWMTPQPPKPSAHEVMTGGFSPSPDDANLGRAPGFGMTINIINGGIECGNGTTPQANSRIDFYKRFTQMLGVSPGENLYCDRMAHY
jgi:chitinase